MPASHPKTARLVTLGLLSSAVVYHFNFFTTPQSAGSIVSAKALSSLGSPLGSLDPAPGQRTVLVTGGAGFIGSHATLSLLAAGNAVIVVDNLSRGNAGALRVLAGIAERRRLAIVPADLGHRAELDKVFAAARVDVVMHFAAIAYVGESVAQPLQYYHNVTANTVTLLESMHGAGVNKLVYSSSCATYGGVPQEAVPVTEDKPTVPNNPYGWSKWMAERVIADFAAANPDFQATILRYFNVYGSDPQGRIGEYPRPQLRHYGRISNACFDAALGNIPELTILGTNHPTRDGSCIRDYIHVTDLIDAHIKVIGVLANPPSVFNVGTGKGVTVKEFVEACKKVTETDIKVVEQRHARPGDYPEMWAVPQKITQETGWSARYLDIEEGLAHAWAWRKAHPAGY